MSEETKQLSDQQGNKVTVFYDPKVPGMYYSIEALEDGRRFCLELPIIAKYYYSGMACNSFLFRDWFTLFSSWPFDLKTLLHFTFDADAYGFYRTKTDFYLRGLFIFFLWHAPITIITEENSQGYFISASKKYEPIPHREVTYLELSQIQDTISYKPALIYKFLVFKFIDLLNYILTGDQSLFVDLSGVGLPEDGHDFIRLFYREAAIRDRPFMFLHKLLGVKELRANPYFLSDF